MQNEMQDLHTLLLCLMLEDIIFSHCRNLSTVNAADAQANKYSGSETQHT